ncbi:MAG: hypothetical protein OXD40_11755 [bacterium]|nr:hypothetical protein [bacterium]
MTPGISETPLLANVPKERIDYMLSKATMTRGGTAVAAMIVWLSSQLCSFSTVAVFDLSGGRATC